MNGRIHQRKLQGGGKEGTKGWKQEKLGQSCPKRQKRKHKASEMRPGCV